MSHSHLLETGYDTCFILTDSYSGTDPNQDQLILFEPFTADHSVDPEWILSWRDKQKRKISCLKGHRRDAVKTVRLAKWLLMCKQDITPLLL